MPFARDAAARADIRQADNALIGIAALALDAREAEAAAEIILASHRPGHFALARLVADDIGVLDE